MKRTPKYNRLFKSGRIFLLVFSCGVYLSVSPAVEAGPTTDQLRDLVAAKWGIDHVVLPSATVLVQYELDLGERWIIDFEAGEVVLECLWPDDMPMDNPEVTIAMACAVSNLYTSVPVMPEMMIEEQQQAGYVPALAGQGNARRYTVKKGDTLFGISKQFRVSVHDIVSANGLSDPDHLYIDQKLAIPDSPPHIHFAGETHARAEESILKGQLIDPETGGAIDAQSVGVFGHNLQKRNGIETEQIRGTDGQTRRLSRLHFSLAEQHLQVRARRFYPLIYEYAKHFDQDPAVIMAMVHTESAFNPMASSAANAYGLMQLVPASGAREAYRWLFQKDITPSPSYLLQPRQNIELGTAYMKVLQERVFKNIVDPTSRLYCAVAAYNGGSGNVGRAFTGRKSIRSSLPEINAATPDQVRHTLQADAPHKETRDYVQRVFDRIPLYHADVWNQSG